MNRCIYCILLFCLNIILCSGQKIRGVEASIQYDIDFSPETTKIRLLSLIPNDLPGKQRVNSIVFSVEPDTIYFEGDNKFAEFIVTDRENSIIRIDADITFFRSDYQTLSRSKELELLSDTLDMKRYLQAETFIDSDHPEILTIAGKLIGKDRAKSVRKIYDYVVNTISYSHYIPFPQGSLITLHSKGGDCSDFSHLMVAICRAASIPARSVYGLVYPYSNTSKHDWVEVYFDDIGWVTFEPTSGNNAQFDRIDKIYLNLFPEGSTKLFDKSFFYRSWYWGSRSPINATYNISEKKSKR